jgi:hypothetical protein
VGGWLGTQVQAVVGSLQVEAEGGSSYLEGGTACQEEVLLDKGGWVRAGTLAAVLLLLRAQALCGDDVPPLVDCPAASHTQ